MRWIKKTLWGVFLGVSLMGLVHAADIDLWDSWRKGFESYEAAEAEFRKNNMDEALKLYRRSHQTFLDIRKASPEWNKEVITYRISLCLRKINAIEKPRKEAAEEARRKSNLEKLHGEIDTLKKQLRQTRVELIDAKSAAERNALTENQVKKLMAENSELSRKLSASNASVSSLKADLAKADKSARYQQQLLGVKTDLEKANQEISRLKNEVENQKNRSRKFQEQRSQAEGKLFRLEAQVKDLDAERKKVSALTEENKKLAESLSSVSGRLRQSERKLSDSVKKNAELAEKVDGLESGKIVSPSEQKLRQELADARKDNAFLRELSEKQKLDLKTLSADSEKQSEENRKVVLGLVKATSSLASLRADYDKLLRTLEEQKKLAENSRVLSVENAVLKKNIDDIARKNEELQQSGKNENAEKLKQLATELNNVKANFKITEEKLRQSELDRKAAAGKLQSTISKLEEEKSLLRQSAALAKQETNAVKTSLEKLTVQYETLKSEFDDLVGEGKKTAEAPAEAKSPEKAAAEPVKVVVKEFVRDTEKETALAEEIAGLKEKMNVLTRENAKLRVRTASFETLQKENGELREKIRTAASAPAGTDDPSGAKEKLSGGEKEISALKNANAELEKALAAEKEDSRKKEASASANYAELKTSLDLLKKQLETAQNSETRARKDLALLKMEFGDLEGKLSSSVSRDELKKAKDELDKTRKELSDLRTAKVESDASLKASEDLVKLQKSRLDAYAKAVDPTAKDRIVKLTATVTELQEAKIQYESTIRDLKGKQEQLSEDAKALRLANAALEGQVAELKVKPEEYLKKSNDLLQKNMKLEDRLKTVQENLTATSAKLKTNEQETARLARELKTTKSLADRYRSELNDWGDASLSETSANMKRKDQAIDELVKENSDLRKERDILSTELSLSKNLAVKYRKYSRDIEGKLQSNRKVLARMKTALARRTSGEEVEKLVADELGKGKISISVEPPPKPAEKPAEEKESAPELTPAQIAAREKNFKEAMETGGEAERAENYSDALAAYWRAADFNPQSPEARMALARTYLARKDLKNAASCYRIAVEKLKMSRNKEFEEKLSNLSKEQEKPLKP